MKNRNALQPQAAGLNRILVVDDSESVQALSRNTLEDLGFEVVCIASGSEAIRWLTSHPVSLVLLDYRLPDMTGQDVVRKLLDAGLKIPFVAITAHGDEKIAVEMMKLGALDYLAKDEVFTQMLPSVVSQVLGHLENEERVAAAEQMAMESEGRFRSIFENAAAGMVTVSPDGKLLQVNPQFCRYLGYEASELLKMDIEAVTHPDDREASRRLYHELKTQQRTALDYEKRYVRRDGSITWGHATVAGVRDKNGDLLYCIALVQDITDRKRYEEMIAQSELALRQSEQRYRKLSQEFQALLDGIPDAILLLAPDLEVIWANSASERQFREKNNDRSNAFCSSFCGNAPGTRSCSRCPVTLSFSTGSMEEGVIRHPQGSIWGIKAFPLKNAEGEVSRVIMLASDITEKTRLREEADRAGRLAAVGELSAGVAHEINNPTGLILMNMPVIRDALAEISPVLEEHYRLHGDFPFGGLKYSKMKTQMPLLMGEILDGAQRIKSIVEDMKDFARGGLEGDCRLFDLNAAVEKAIRLVNNQIRKSTDRFSCSLAGDLPEVMGNSQRIEQVLVNLILNACQAMPGKTGGLFVSTCFDERSRQCMVLVHDEGVGIPDKNLPHLTDPFFTTRREAGGTGLGLSVSERIVREHGGSLRFESSLGEGTTVTLALPAALGGVIGGGI